MRTAQRRRRGLVLPPVVGAASLAAGWALRFRAASLALADGASVSTWPAESGQSATLTPTGTAPTYAAGGVGGRPAVRFGPALTPLQTGTLPTPVAAPATYHAVLRSTSAASLPRGRCG